MRSRSHSLIGTAVLGLALALGTAVPDAVYAQSDYAVEALFMNPDGGLTTTDGFKIATVSGEYIVHYNNLRQTGTQGYSMGIAAEGRLIGQLGGPDVASTVSPTSTQISILTRADSGGSTRRNWDAAVTTVEQIGPDTWQSVATMSETLDTGSFGTYAMVVTTTYTRPNPWFDIEVTVYPPANAVGGVNLFIGGDSYIDGSDAGAGILGNRAGRRFIAQYDDQSGRDVIAGFREVAGSEFSSYIVANYQCPIGNTHTPHCPARGGPAAAYADEMPYDTKVITDRHDAGIGAHWALGGGSDPKTISFQFVRMDYSAFLQLADGPGLQTLGESAGTLSAPLETTGGAYTLSVPAGSPVTLAPLPINDALTMFVDGAPYTPGTPLGPFTLNPGETREVEITVTTSDGISSVYTITLAGLAGAPAQCQQTPDMAVSPQFIELAPGGSATVEVAMRNLCDDAPYAGSDLLVSFSDGLSVTGGSDGLVNLGQRAAWQGFALAPGETRRWTVTVSAAESLSVAPLHITELFNGGRAVARIDGVFITPAPTAAPVAAAPAEPAPPAAPAAPAPLPAALPNTAGADAAMPLLTALAALVLLSSALLLRRKRS
jgi:hypothetical protein